MAHILLVEDEAILRGLIKNELLKEGHTVVEAHNGIEAQEAVKKESPELILLDLMMPYLSGYDVLEWLKGNNEYKDIPCIVISNSGQPSDLQRVFDMGATDVLVKVEFTPNQVATKIRQILASTNLE